MLSENLQFSYTFYKQIIYKFSILVTLCSYFYWAFVLQLCVIITFIGNNAGWTSDYDCMNEKVAYKANCSLLNFSSNYGYFSLENN